MLSSLLSLVTVWLFQIWNSHNLFSDADSAERFQGILDTAFMAAYAIVSIILESHEQCH